MTKTSFTPGPWEIGRVNSGPVAGAIPITTQGYRETFRDGVLITSVYGAAARSEANLRWAVDECPDANGFATIRLNDGSPNGNTDLNPIATVYDWDSAPVIAAAPDMYEALQAGAEMRQAQATYFKDRTRENLIASKEAEKRFDTLTKAALAKAEGRS